MTTRAQARASDADRTVEDSVCDGFGGSLAENIFVGEEAAGAADTITEANRSTAPCHGTEGLDRSHEEQVGDAGHDA